jgi:hypothetical protein
VTQDITSLLILNILPNQANAKMNQKEEVIQNTSAASNCSLSSKTEEEKG